MLWDVSIHFTRSPMKVWFTWDSNHLLNIFLIVFMLWAWLLSSWPWNHPVKCIHFDMWNVLPYNQLLFCCYVDWYFYIHCTCLMNHLEIPTLCHLTYLVYSAMPWLRWLAISLSPWRHEFIPTEVHVGFVVYTWRWGRFCLWVCKFSPVIILPMPHTHISFICHQSYMILSINGIVK
jgi:hypothetical protein